MKIHYLQHEPFEDIGNIELWIKERGYSVSKTRLYADPLPHADDIDFLIIMGGAMSVNDEKTIPWLKPEKIFIEKFIKSGKPVIGICLGAQLLANVLGAKVYKNRYREIGWFPVHLTQEAASIAPLKNIPEVFTPFHWHGETFNIPEKAVRFAASEACENQGFFYGKNVCALQFHPEISEKSVNDLLKFCSGDIKPGQFIHSQAKIVEMSAKFILESNKIMFELLDNLQKF